MHPEIEIPAMTLAIDPSINSLGWAIFQKRDLIVSGTCHSAADERQFPMNLRIYFMIETLECVVRNYVHDANDFGLHVVIEQSEAWGSAKSMASTQSGTLPNLHVLIGALLYWGWTRGYAALVKVTTWKGQLPKHVTQKRLQEKYERIFQTNDEADAVGVGDYYVNKVRKFGDNDGDGIKETE